MSYTVVRDTIDYTWVLARQYDRIAELGTKYFSPGGESALLVLRGYIGAVWMLYRLARPIIRDLPDYDRAFAEIIRIHRDRMDYAWHKASQVLEEVTKALYARGLLIRRSMLDEGL